MREAAVNNTETNIDNHSELQPVFDLEKFGIGVDEIKVEAQKLATEKQGKEITGEQLLLTDPGDKAPCLWEPFFPQVGVGCLAGGSDIGKSALLRQMGIQVASGSDDFLGHLLKPKHSSAIYVSSEDAQREVSYLLSKQCSGMNPSLMAGLRFIFDIENLARELEQSLTTKPADVVFIDCFADVYGGDLKDTTKVRQFLHSYQTLAQKHQTLIIFLHHTGKRTENFEPSKNNLLSGQGFESKMRIVIELRADLMDPTLRHLCVVKGNYLPAHFKRESFMLRFDEGSFRFTSTGERMPYELLVKQPDADASKAKYFQAVELKEAGMNYDQIAKAIGYNSKGSVSKLFDKAKNQGWETSVSNSFPTGNKGNQQETPF